MESIEAEDVDLFKEDDNDEAEITFKKKRTKRSFLRVLAAFIGYCPMCDGEVYGAVDSAKCIDCGWTNRNSKFGWG